jgi:hypothetical protein
MAVDCFFHYFPFHGSRTVRACLQLTHVGRHFYIWNIHRLDSLCGLVVRVPGYRSRGPGFDSQRWQIFWEVIGLESSPLSLQSTPEELLGGNSSGSGLRNRKYGRGDPMCWPRDTLYPQKLALTSLTSSGCSVGIVCSRTKVTEFFWGGGVHGLRFLLQVCFESECLIKRFVLVASYVSCFMFLSTNMKISRIRNRFSVLGILGVLDFVRRPVF